MTRSMLIDASHPEETRVVVVKDRQLQEFDYESANKKQLKGNIYLAKVTRVEPSLQAAFVDYGGQRHGFLAFSEIHPDYYQIPQADRRLLEEAVQAEQQAESGDFESAHAEGEDEAVEAVATDPDEETAEVYAEQARKRQRLLRSYKIQEVIKRRQILLVQVVKEERGNKGAALTTYLSLAGRYCVLMPNTARGGGISRKIINPKDRHRLKAIARELEVPQGMGLIIRTAGQERNKLEIRRDYDYLLRLWSDIRERTLASIAPCTIHEEGALIKRAIRDLYESDIDDIMVEGDEAYKAARKIMSMLMPSRVRKVKQYKEDQPLFHSHEIEAQLDLLHKPAVELRSGGSIVIHTTEALTAVDVNSGRSTRERNIEETALKTNLEAADEVARQMRLRDLAGLIVVDFIDMAEARNQRAVERRLRDALKYDRARVQLGRISAFGLLELSRQRLRPSLLELSAQPCPTCAGSGTIRSTESAALQALRQVELVGIKGAAAAVSLSLPLPVALYLLNQKRDLLVGLEQRYAMGVDVRVGPQLIAGELALDVLQPREKALDEAQRAAPAEPVAEPPAEAPARVAKAAPPPRPAARPPVAADAQEDDENGQRKRRRRRRRRRRGGGEAEVENQPLAAGSDFEPEPITPAADADAELALPVLAEVPLPAELPAADSDEPAVAAASDGEGDAAAPSPPRRARRPRTRRAAGATVAAAPSEPAPTPVAADAPLGAADAPVAAEGEADEERAPRRRRRPTRSRRAEPEAAPDAASPAAASPVPAAEPVEWTAAAKPAAVPVNSPAASPPPAAEPAPAAEGPTRNGGYPLAAAAADEAEPAEDELPPAMVAGGEDAEDDGPPRRGWWSRFVRKE